MLEKNMAFAILILISGIAIPKFVRADSDTIDFANTPAPEGVDPGTCWANYTYLPSLGIDASQAVWNLTGHSSGATYPCFSNAISGYGSPAVTAAISGNYSLNLWLNQSIFPQATSVALTVTAICFQGGDFAAIPTRVTAVSSQGALPPIDGARARNTNILVTAPVGATLKSVSIQANPVSGECPYIPLVMMTGGITVQSGPGPTPTPTPTPSPTPSPSPTPTHFALEISIKPKSNRPNLQTVQGVPTLAMKPTIFGCGQIPFYSDDRTFVLKCINKVTRESVDGCRFVTHLKSGPKNGGHEHDYDSRPLGQVYADETLSIPAAGMEFTYLAPEVSGDVDFSITGIGPQGEAVSPAFLRMDLRVENFQVMEVDNLSFSVKSHPQGVYGTATLNTKLKLSMSMFQESLKVEGIQIPRLESQSASLPWGGLFDIEYAEYSPWASPHCSHRDGRRIDISLSTFKNYSNDDREAILYFLDLSFRKYGLEPSVEGDHWHVGY